MWDPAQYRTFVSFFITKLWDITVSDVFFLLTPWPLYDIFVIGYNFFCAEYLMKLWENCHKFMKYFH